MQIFLFNFASRPAPQAAQPPKEWILRTLSLDVKKHHFHSNQSPLSNAEG